MAAIELKSVRKSFQALEVIHGIDLKIADGGFTVFVGPSGCGKSTLLRMMAGLEEPSGGEIWIDGSRCDHLLPSARGMAMVFQSYALYPHMSVEDNLRFGLENQRLPKAEVRRRIDVAADILQIPHLLKRRPNQLSGGQSQRVAIGRAIVKEPKAFLFDEPLSNLDAELRVKMRSEIVALHHRLGATMIFVTHDQVEAMTMADTIVVLRDGVVEQVGSPIELYARPRNHFVAGFIGGPQMNFVAARVGKIRGQSMDLLFDEGRGVLSANVEGLTIGTAVTVGVRPEHLVPSESGSLAGVVTSVEMLGADTVVFALLQSGERITASLRGVHDLPTGAPIRFAVDERFVHVFGEDGLARMPTRAWRDDYLNH